MTQFRSRVIVHDRSDEGLFWLSASGSPMTNLGRYAFHFRFIVDRLADVSVVSSRSMDCTSQQQLSGAFGSDCLLCFDFSSCRKMQHTVAHEAVMDNTIPEAYEEALTLTQGHSRETTQRYYVKKQMERAATTACLAHKRLHGEFVAPNIPRPTLGQVEYLPEGKPLLPFSTLDIILLSDFVLDENQNEEINATLSPVRKRTRINWSNEEEAWIAGWVSKYVHGATYEKRINWKAAVKEINNSEAKEIFHPEHIDSTKLMECAKRLAKKYGVSVNELTNNTVCSPDPRVF